MITIKTQVKVGVSDIWTYWTSPEHIVNWNFANEDWHCPKAESNLIPGGKFNYTMASKDGNMSFGFEGQFIDIKPKEFLSYHTSDGRKVEIKFKDTGDYVEIFESFEPETMNPEEMQKAGWQAILDNFKRYAESI